MHRRRRDFLRAGAAAGLGATLGRGTFPPDVRDVRIERVTCDRAKRVNRAVGVPEAPFRDVVLRDVTVRSAPAPHEIRHVAGLPLENVRVDGAPVTLPPTIG